MILWQTLSLTLFDTTAVSLSLAAGLAILSSMISVPGHVTYMNTFSCHSYVQCCIKSVYIACVQPLYG